MPTPLVAGPDPGQEYRAAMREVIATQWAAVWKAVPAVIASDDPGAVHKVRVASRRLRAAMDVATDCFPRKWYRPLHKTAKTITKSLGEVRDRDVLLEALAKQRDEASADARLGIDHLMAGVERERKQARKAMLRFLATLESEQIRKETKRRFARPKESRGRKKEGSAPAPRHAAAPPAVDHPGGESRGSMPSLDPTASLAANARRVLAVRVDDLFSYAPIMPDAEATELLHDARIATKRLRYTLELFPTVFGEQGDRVITQLQALQETLGQLHDHDVRIERMDEALATLADPAALRPSLVALLEDEQTSRATQHVAVVEYWRRLEHEQVQERLMALTLPAVGFHAG